VAAGKHFSCLHGGSPAAPGGEGDKRLDMSSIKASFEDKKQKD